MEGVRLIRKPVLRNPVLVCCWPGMGDVAYRAGTYLVERLGAKPFAELLAQDFFYLANSIVKSGVLSLPPPANGMFYCWKNPREKRDFVFFISTAQPDLTKAEKYCRQILSVARALRIKQAVTFAAMPQPIDHTQPPQVWCVATDEQVKRSLQRYQVEFLSEGAISGMNGVFLGAAKEAGYPGFCLLGEIPLYTIQIENPKAAQAVLEIFSKIAGLAVDLSGLKEQVGTMEEQLTQLMDFLKVQPSDGPIGEEEIERIKKSLNQLTHLPISVKEKIEKLFKQTTVDLSKAQELKAELDRWNVYKEYEDRFLDLFKKRREKGN